MSEFYYDKYRLTTDKKLENELQLELFCYLWDWPIKSGGLGKAGHFKQIVNILWGPKNKSCHFQWNPWADRMNEVCHEYNYVALNGCASCVAGHTRIPNPITGEQPTIKELFESQTSPVVMTMDGPVQATVPFIKGEEILYEVVLSNGHRFTGTASHRVMLANGDYASISALMVGSLLSGYGPCLLRSTSGIAPLIHGVNAQHSQKTTEGCLGDYSACFCPDGEPLLPASNTGQSFAPSPAGVPQCMEYASVCLDDLGNKASRIHPYQHAFHRAKRHTLGRRSSLENRGLRRCAEEIASPEFQLCQPLWPSGSGLRLLNPFSKPDHGYGCTPNFFLKKVFFLPNKSASFSSSDYAVSPVAVSSIRATGRELFYDLQVPGPNHYFAEGAIHHNSGKSFYAALYAIVNWLCCPADALVFVTTTGLKDAQARIWGSIEKLWLAAPGLPGKLLSSQYQIYSVDATGQKLSGQCGINLLASEKKKEKESMSKLIGAKASRVFLIGDEMPELSEALITTAQFNLVANPFFQMIGIGNFKTRYDPFGTFVEPKDGWDSINIDSEEWETTSGYCVRFDGFKSPNVLAGKVLYPKIYDEATLLSHRRSHGENTAAFYRMCRSYEAPITVDDAVYSESDFAQGLAYQVPGRDCQWEDRQHRWSAMDPSFTNGGDRCVQCFGWYGMMNGKPTVSVDKFVILRSDVRRKDVTHSRQIAEQFRDNCVAEGVNPKHAAMDSTAGGGIVLADYIAEIWSNKVLRVDFSGAVSESYVGADGGKTAKESYDRRVTELWCVGVEFLKYGQLKGLTQEVTREMKARKFDTVKGSAGLKMRVQTKIEMKKLLGFSPDLADCFFVGIALCRERLGLVAGGPDSHYSQSNDSWDEQCRISNAIYANGDYGE